MSQKTEGPVAAQESESIEASAQIAIAAAKVLVGQGAITPEQGAQLGMQINALRNQVQGADPINISSEKMNGTEGATKVLENNIPQVEYIGWGMRTAKSHLEVGKLLRTILPDGNSDSKPLKMDQSDGHFNNKEDSKKFQIGGIVPSSHKMQQMTIGLIPGGKAAESLSSSFQKSVSWVKNISLRASNNAKEAIVARVNQAKMIAEFGAEKVLDMGHGVYKGFQFAAQQPVSENVSDLGTSLIRSFVTNKDPAQAIKIIVGVPFSVLSGDIFDKQVPAAFDRDPGSPAVVVITGMACRPADLYNMDKIASDALGIRRCAQVTNFTHINLPRMGNTIIDPGFGDIFSQMIGTEYFNTVDITVVHAAEAMRRGIAEKGFVLAIGHSQGTAIARRALSLLTAEERKKVHIYGAGSEWYIDEKRIGVGSAWNARNVEDPVPILGMMTGMASNVLPWNWDRIADAGRGWRVFNSTQNQTPKGEKGNKHDFGIYYLESLRDWATEMRRRGILK
ncbi:MAG: hypothetical protein IPP68_09900 [Elusimicrobia bacterium]|nr:hypothetical protein [Elusimicrobiota bacterium]